LQLGRNWDPDQRVRLLLTDADQAITADALPPHVEDIAGSLYGVNVQAER